ncbi:uncharacterized protein LOC110609790 isoform X1 [Manihot esculenta]|uniref:Uncharacterized protein n=1 Tax=Manihot esculenta TaxID=3983 RepID=A0A2C9WEY5_MANES|nr:uncharacterized protein LOC110609790 isoform X1 [Manihot esculenta]OAY58410.1 hypothetical protein MANES_02G175700v8 [Manihot esculenta]
MGSIGEEELFDQMVRDYYESESNTPNNIPSIIISSRHQSILQGILLEATDFEKQVLERVLMYIRNMGEPSSLKKWVVMRLQIDGYKASLCKTSWVSTSARSKVFQYVGDYEYIEVMMNINNSGKPTRIITDMEFRTQFEVARPTQTYKELIATLPSIFVATEERLNKIVSLICSAAKESLKEKGLHIPPWRKAKYMQLKWFSKNCKKVSVSPSTEMGSQENVEKGTVITNSTATAKCCPSLF